LFAVLAFSIVQRLEASLVAARRSLPVCQKEDGFTLSCLAQPKWLRRSRNHRELPRFKRCARKALRAAKRLKAQSAARGKARARIERQRTARSAALATAWRRGWFDPAHLVAERARTELEFADDRLPGAFVRHHSARRSGPLRRITAKDWLAK